jgi:hypothetical protein
MDEAGVVKQTTTEQVIQTHQLSAKAPNPRSPQKGCLWQIPTEVSPWENRSLQKERFPYLD